jgi:hypothetical protein
MVSKLWDEEAREAYEKKLEKKTAIILTLFILFIIFSFIASFIWIGYSKKEMSTPIVYTAKNSDGTIRECVYLRISGTIECDGKVIKESK